jgi:fructose-bisphosphate aldolase class II
MIKSYNGAGYCLFLNADHTHSIERLVEFVKAGYDSVIFDASKFDLEENIKKTKEAVLAAKEINSEVLVEGELGYVGASSKVLESIPEDVSLDPEDLPTAKEAKRFVEETEVDMLAPAVGNIHGMLAPSDSESSSGMKKAKNPDLNIERIKEIKEAVNIPLVLHGGSGLTDDNFKKAIKAGISLIHVSTEIRAAWRNSFEKALEENPDEIAPYKIIPPVIKKMEEVVEGKVKLFYNL